MGEPRLICLDDNFIIGALRAGSPQDQALQRWLGDEETVRTRVIAWAEFLCGPVSPDRVGLASALILEPIPLVPTDAARAAELFNATGRRRGSLADCLIAATCLRLGAQLATENVDDFRRFAPMGLQLVR